MWIHYETRKLYDKNIQLDKLDIDKLKNFPTNLRNLKTKVDNLDVDKLVPVSAHLSKLSDTVKNDIAKKMCIMLRSKILKVKHLILLTYLLMLLLMLKLMKLILLI